MVADTQHISVMSSEVLEGLRAAEGGAFLDCTAGGGGHSAALLEINSRNTVAAFDRDAEAVARAQARLAPFGARAQVAQASFSQLEEALHGRPPFDGVLADLGVSTDQLKDSRGFSFHDEGPLDMRMDRSQTTTAAEVLEKSSEQELYVVLRRGGVGPEARRVARAIVRARPIASARQLGEIVQKAAGAGARREKKIHPATVVFQALRIEVNREFEELEALIRLVPHVIKRGGGRFAVITFHSLEDRLVAGGMRAWQAGSAQHASSRVLAQSGRLGRLVHKKAVRPGLEEIERNVSARSARLRVFEFS